MAAKKETKKSPVKKSEKTIEVLFTQSPTGRFKLAYGTGSKAFFPVDFAKELIDLGYAVEAKG